MNPTWKAAIGVLLVFILGWFCGVLCTWIFVHHKMVALAKGGSMVIATALDRQATRGMKLTDDQQAKVYALLLENVRERSKLQNTIKPQVWAINQQTLQGINGVLNPEQQRKFQDNLVLFEKNFGRDPLSTGEDEKAGTNATPSSSASAGTNVGTPPPQ
jgi:hypothetical protein